MMNKFDFWSDWEKAKKWLTARIIPLTKTSAQYFSDRPYQMITNTDTAVVWDLITMQPNLGVKRTAVTWDLIKHWEVTMDDIWEVSSDMTPKHFPAIIRPLDKMLPANFKSLANSIPMVVVSNQSFNYGVISLCYENTAYIIRTLLNDDFYIMPSSIHDAICVSKSILPPNDLLLLVTTINHDADTMKEELILVDDVWEFDEELLVSALHPYKPHPSTKSQPKNLVPVYVNSCDNERR